MKITTRGRYGLRALVDLAVHEQVGTVSLASIAKRQGLSMNYMEQNFALLKKAGLIKSTKGAQGGYQLKVKPEELTVFKILQVLEGDLSIVEEDQRETTTISEFIKHQLWERIDDVVTQKLLSVTLEDLVGIYKQQKDSYEPIYDI